MIRSGWLATLMLAFMLATVGCAKERHDMPVKASPGVDPKTGKARKTFEASLEEPPPGKK